MRTWAITTTRQPLGSGHVFTSCACQSASPVLCCKIRTSQLQHSTALSSMHLCHPEHQAATPPHPFVPALWPLFASACSTHSVGGPRHAC
jgi:hypothetical protein